MNEETKKNILRKSSTNKVIYGEMKLINLNDRSFYVLSTYYKVIFID